MLTAVSGFLLDESKGEFTNERGEKIQYHNARFYNMDEKKVFKAAISKESNVLPEEQVHCLLRFDVMAGEKFCRLVYNSYELLK